MEKSIKQIQQKLGLILTNLPLKKLEQVADYAEYLKSREEWEATMELMNDPAMSKDIEEGIAQSSQGEGRSWREIKHNL
ncbi:MAG: hypothetical protein AB1656_16530 [Candidatus Omnitrophota bacterium]